jgi:hypothetical protein
MARGRTQPIDSKQLETILREIDERRKDAEAKGLSFTAPTEDQLKAKLQRVKSPMIVFQSWTGTATQGGQVNYTVGIHNPDPTASSSLYVHVLVGPANFVSDVGEALATADERFPKLTLPQFFGLRVDPGRTEQLAFTIDIPEVVDSNYLGNSFLFQADYHDVGSYLDRSVFPFTVS